VSNRNPGDRTLGGLAGKLVGRAKEALASATGNDQPAREDDPRETRSVSELGSESDAAQREQRLERDRVQGGAGTGARPTGAERSLLAAEQVRLAATEEAHRLEREAREAKRRRAP
jgi:hypothetical protein